MLIIVKKARRKQLDWLPVRCQTCGLNCDVHNHNWESGRINRHACDKVDWG